MLQLVVNQMVYIRQMEKKYKKYIVFHYAQYYPAGGLDDIIGSYDSLDDAKKTASRGDQIVDRDTWEIVWCDQK